MKNFMMLCLALLMSLSLMAQQRRITGTVTDIRDNSAMIGVTVLEKGTNNGTVTDIEGNFSINVISDNPVLSLSSIGYRTIEINVGSESHLTHVSHFPQTIDKEIEGKCVILYISV